MPESNHVAKFMDYDSKFIATFSDRYSLTSIPTFSNKGTAAEKIISVLSKLKSLYFWIVIECNLNKIFQDYFDNDGKEGSILLI